MSAGSQALEQVSVADAKARFPELFADVMAGKSFIITDEGKPITLFEPMTEAEKQAFRESGERPATSE